MQGFWSELQRRLSTLLDVYNVFFGATRFVGVEKMVGGLMSSSSHLKATSVPRNPSAAHPPLAPPVGGFCGFCKQQPVSAQLSWMLVGLSQGFKLV